MGDSHTNWTTMFLQILFLICSVCNTYGVASTASPSCPADEYRAGQLCCLACPGGKNPSTQLLSSCCPKYFCKISSTKSIGKQHILTFFPTGYRVHRDCTATFNTLCSKCPDDTFKEDLSGQKQCSACTECVTGTSKLLNGNAPHATPICCVDENVVLSMFVSEVVLFMFISEKFCSC